MKILFINHEKELNGASRSMVDIISKLNQKCEIYVLTFTNNGSVYNTLMGMNNVKVIVYPYHSYHISRNNKFKWIKKIIKWNIYYKFINTYTAKKVSRFVIENKIDIIHSNTSVICIGALIKKKTNVKHVLHIREFGDLDFNLYPLFNKKRYWNIMNKYTDKFICITKAIYKHYNNLEDKRIVIYNGVGEENIIKRKKKKDNCVNFLIAGRICKTKGQYLVVEAVRYLVSNGITNFKVYMAGREVEELIIDDNISNYIEKVGQINDLPTFRKNIDVELVCSKSEAFGRIVVEAMLGGIPVIGSNSGGIPELIIDGRNGCLFKQGDFVDLADKMKLLINDSEKRKSMGKFAREYSKERFLSQRCADEIYELYKSIL